MFKSTIIIKLTFDGVYFKKKKLTKLNVIIDIHYNEIL
jgi:hypothetical protein